MRPQIICHMITSLDGRLLPSRWSDSADRNIWDLIEAHYEPAADSFNAGGWIVGRKTMAEYVSQEEHPELLGTAMPRDNAFAVAGDRSLAIAIDPQGRLRPEASELADEHLVVVLSERVPNATLAKLNQAGVSYVFAGPEGDRLEQALTAIGEAFGVERLLLEGGGTTNGTFWTAGLIDEFSVLICPTLDGLKGVPGIVDAAGAPDDLPGAGQGLRLLSSEVLDGGVVWLRHEVVRASRH
ncbi:dihydrofolate reductase family protein [Marinobacterium lutimaris]|uniref:5-amino-6-(5-phosphoribosylamino)uracil reductase n=1 Tax=Marinobacterium lutimaris TaxID=568106 RepID=A0A1H6C2N1_9GAMM|nr:dihydrofolate reductase family protein [Marinobacterium lutimaris]SEG67208.1 5-amino-6-(5-phosphoribosylamino)uracil reductase [Marinobacterium lutimaris]